MGQDDKLRQQRLKLKRDIADLQQGKMGLIVETRRFVPTTFVEAYYLLADRGMKTSLGSPLAGVNDVSMTGAGMQQIKDTFVTSTGGLRDERARKYRDSVDRRLRGMAREILQVMSNGEMVPEVKCLRCNRFCASEWKHCAWCGEPTADAARNGGSD